MQINIFFLQKEPIFHVLFTDLNGKHPMKYTF